jgi:hypothetical protein
MVLSLPWVCFRIPWVLGYGLLQCFWMLSFVLAVARVPLSLLPLVYALECVSPNDYACGPYTSLQICQ